jgi:hypothetical protein
LDTAEKVREARLRRAAARQGYALAKTRRRDPNAWDYGTYMITDLRTNAVVAGTEVIGRPSWTLDDIEGWLATGNDAVKTEAGWMKIYSMLYDRYGCSTCGAAAGEPCRHPNGDEADYAHEPRFAAWLADAQVALPFLPWGGTHWSRDLRKVMVARYCCGYCQAEPGEKCHHMDGLHADDPNHPAWVHYDRVDRWAADLAALLVAPAAA